MHEWKVIRIDPCRTKDQNPLVVLQNDTTKRTVSVWWLLGKTVIEPDEPIEYATEEDEE